MAATATLERAAMPAVDGTLSFPRLNVRSAFTTVGAIGVASALVASGVALGGLVRDPAASQESADLAAALNQVQGIERYDGALQANPAALLNSSALVTAINAIPRSLLTADEERTLTALAGDWDRWFTDTTRAADRPGAAVDAERVTEDIHAQTAALHWSLQERAVTAALATERQATQTRVLLLAAILGTLLVLGLSLAVVHRVLRPQRALAAVAAALTTPLNHVLDLTPPLDPVDLWGTGPGATLATPAAAEAATSAGEEAQHPAGRLVEEVGALDRQFRSHTATAADMHGLITRIAEQQEEAAVETTTASSGAPRSALEELARMAADLQDTATWFTD